MKFFEIIFFTGFITILLICPLEFRPQSSTSPAQWILIDKSGSMRGFFTTGQIGQLNDFIAKNTAAKTDSFYFIDDYKKKLDETATEEFGNNTYLNTTLTNTLSARPQPSIIWLITDNQPSGNGESDSDKDIKDFYSTLRSEAIKRIVFFPLKINFEGKLFTVDDQILEEKYNGKRGLLVYALLLDEKYKDDFENSVSGFENAANTGLGNSSPVRKILIKPLESETVSAKLVSIPGEKLKVENNKISGSDFDENQPIMGKFGIELDSKLGLIKIDEATIDAQKGDFFTNDFSTPHPKADISPKKIENFIAGQNLPPFVVTLTLEPMQVEDSFSSIWKSLSSKRGDITGEIFITITIPSSKFSPISGFKEEFSTDKNIFNDASPEVQERIYNLKGLMEQMISTDTQIIKPSINDNTEGSIPVHLSARFNSGWRAVYLLLPLIVLIILITALIFFSRNINTAKYRLTWNREQYLAMNDFSLPIFFGQQKIIIDGQSVAGIKKSFSDIKVKADKGYTIDGQIRQSLSDMGSDFNIVRDIDGGTVDFQFKEIKNSAASGRITDSDDWTDEYYVSSGFQTYDNELPLKTPTFGDSKHTSSDDKAEIDLDDFFN